MRQLRSESTKALTGAVKGVDYPVAHEDPGSTHRPCHTGPPCQGAGPGRVSPGQWVAGGAAKEGQLRAEAGRCRSGEGSPREGWREGWRQPVGTSEAGQGLGVAALLCPPPPRRAVRGPAHREGPTTAAPAKQAATWLGCGFPSSQLLIFGGPLLYFNACFYGNIYGAHVARKTPL